MKKSNSLLEFPRIDTPEEIVNVDSRTYSMVDEFDVYDSAEYEELAKRTESSAKQLIEKDREHRRTNFQY